MKLGYLVNEAKDFLSQYKSQSPAAYAAAQQAIGGLLILDGFTGIDNPFEGKNRPGIFGAIITIIFGIIFMFVPTFFNSISGLNKLTAKTNATIVSVSQHQLTTNTGNGSQADTSCTAVAKYTVNGKVYTQASSFGSSNMCGLTSGQTTQISYNPNNPGQWGTDVKTISSVIKIFFFAGIFVVIAGLVTFAIRLLSIIFGWKLLKSGRALAKTLPPGTELKTAIKQIEQGFKTSLFGYPAPAPPTVPATQLAMPPQQTAPTQPIVPVQPAAQPQPVLPQQPITPEASPTSPDQNSTPPQNDNLSPQ